ncbi:MAG: hypothetical protein ACRDM7_09990 [Thermoleophilaceae bacterium]
MHTHALLEHKCPTEHFCERMTRQYGDGKPAKVLARASDETVTDERHDRSAEPEPEDPDLPPKNRLVKFSDEEAQRYGLEDWRHYRYFWLNGHILRCRDKDVGARMYGAEPGKRKKKFWVGGYFVPAIDHFHKAPTALHFFEADIQEHHGYPELYRKLLIALGKDRHGRQRRPVSVIADRAWNNASFIGFNTHENVASITPERKLPGGKDITHLRGEHWDEHGPRCKHCGGPAIPVHMGGKNVGFVVTKTGDPRIRYRCGLQWFPECAKAQTISCRKEVRALLPISRRDPRFHGLNATHKTYESIFDSWRDRYAVSGTHHAKRSKRRDSIAAQRLRAASALLAEWFRICMRQGYLGQHTNPNTQPPEVSDDDGGGLDKVEQHRHKHLLELPMGRVAYDRGIIGKAPDWQYCAADPDPPGQFLAPHHQQPPPQPTVREIAPGRSLLFPARRGAIAGPCAATHDEGRPKRRPSRSFALATSQLLERLPVASLGSGAGFEPATFGL